MDLSTTAQFLGIVYTIAATIAAIAATIGATVSIRNRIINRRAAASASAAEVSSAATSVSVEAMKKRTDDLFTALLRDQSQEKELEAHDKALGLLREDIEACQAELALARAEIAACKRFMWELDAYAHGTGPVPIFSPDETFSTGQHALEGALHDQH